MHWTLRISTALLPAIVLVLHMYRRDKLQREPPEQLLKAALWGVASAFLAMLVSTPFSMLADELGGTDTVVGSLATAFLCASLPEECSKALCLYLFLHNNKYFDEYMDGIVYAVAVGMGFAGFENILYVARADDWATVSFVRACMSVPGHFGFAVLMGYFYSRWRINGDKRSFWLILIVPILFHGAFDAFLMTAKFTAEWGCKLLMYCLTLLMHYLRCGCSLLITRHLKRDKSIMDQIERQRAMEQRELMWQQRTVKLTKQQQRAMKRIEQQRARRERKRQARLERKRRLK